MNMTQALYRKWRPQLWDEVVSQEHIVQTLKNAVTSERVAHAYLFSGPRGTGKTTAARLLAKAVNCLNENKSKRPCNECAHCAAVNENRFMDLIEIDAASNTSVEDVRDLRDKINFSPSQGIYKVYIIDEVHMLSTAAFNALLKTLEEPPPHAIFILATTEIHKIPATVLSRCQRHEFRRVPLGEITRRLSEICKAEKIDVEDGALNLIARQASGGLRDAISLLDQLASIGEKITLPLAQTVLGTATNQSVINIFQAVVEQDAAKGFNEIQSALDGGADARALARQVVDYLRNIMLIQMGNGEQVEVSADARSQMVSHAKEIAVADVLRMMRAFNAAATDTRGGWAPSLGLELAFAEALELPAQPEPAVVKSQVKKNLIKTESPQVLYQDQSQKNTVNSDVFERVVNSWKQVSTLIKQNNADAAALVNSCKPLDIREGILILGFASDILLEKFNKPENVALTRKAMMEVIGADLPIQAVVTGGKGALPPNVKPDGMVAAALQNGGEIVDVQ